MDREGAPIGRLHVCVEQVTLSFMCGRYMLTRTRLTHIEAALNRPFPSLLARYNIARGQLVPGIRQDADGPILEYLQWGLIPL